MSYEIYEFDGRKVKLDLRTRKAGGCFHEHKGELCVESPDLAKFIKLQLMQFTRDDVFIDVGANTGFMSLMLTSGKAFAFEPTPETYDILKHNAELNNKRIYPIPWAVSDGEHSYVLVRNEENPGRNEIMLASGKDFTVALDQCKIEGRIRLVKIDVEGHELAVLDGMKNIIKEHKPMIIIENNASGLEGYNLIGNIDGNEIWRHT
jgi:FkbM family methyltransferase